MKECGTGMQITAALVNELRKKTGAGMGKCKEALLATSGHLDEAERWLKIQGVKPEVTARATGEGAIAIKLTEDGKCVALIELLCETDFAAKGERFLSLADRAATAVLHTPVGTVQEALNLQVEAYTRLDDVIKREISGVIKENIKLNHVTALKFTRPLRGCGIGTYLHSNRKLGVLVGIVTDSEDHAKTPEFQQLLKDIAVHVAGSPNVPQAVYSSDLPLSITEGQKAIFQAQLDAEPKNAKKPDNIKAKIIDGKMAKFYQEVALMDQPFVKDDTKTVRQVVEETSKAIGAEVKIDWFIRRTLGAN